MYSIFLCTPVVKGIARLLSFSLAPSGCWLYIAKTMNTGRIVFMALVLLMGLGIFVHTMFEPDGWTKRARLRADLSKLKSENQRLQETVIQLQTEIKALRTRQDVQEETIRDTLGFIRKDEVSVELRP